MKKLMENKKMIYCIALVIIVIGIIVTCIFKLNFSLMYSSNTRFYMYIGKEYNIDDIKQISKEVFGNEKTVYQEIETFGDAIALTVRNVTDEEAQTFKEKVAEKYELESTESITSNNVGHLRGRDILKPYIVPITIATVLILAYVGIRYVKSGSLKAVVTLLVRIVVSEAVLLSIIAITRIPISVYTMGVAIFVYLIVITLTVRGYQLQTEVAKKEKK